MTEPEINLFHIFYGTITTQDADTAARLLYEFFSRETVAHARHSAAAGCDECRELVERWTEAVAAYHEADARAEDFDTSVFDKTLDDLISHMTLEEDLDAVR